MNGLKRTLLSVTLLLSLAAGGYAGTDPSAAGSTAWSSAEWTKYDWNASAGKSDSAAGFEIEAGEGGVLHISAANPDDARFVRELAVEPDTVYRFSCQVRAENVGSEGRGAGISVSGILDGSRDVKGTSDWQSVEFYGRTGADQHKIAVTVGVGGYGSLNRGSAWFKDVAVEKIASPPQGAAIASLQPPAASAKVSPSGTRKGGMVIALIGVLGLFLLAGGSVIRRKGGDDGSGKSGGDAGGKGSDDGNAVRVSEGEQEERLPAARSESLMHGKDLAVMAAMTAICLGFSLVNLGGHAAPETGWLPATAGESVTVELGREASLSRVYYYCGINERAGDAGRFSLAARNPEGAFVPLAAFAKDDVGNWKYVDVDAKTSAVRLTADVPGGRLNEIAFVEKGSRVPLSGPRIGEKTVSATDQGRPENLIDEQGAFEYAPSFRTGFYFDEIYHARSAWEMLHGIDPFETTHPPLGKMLIASGIAVFGMNAFGWRIVGALFGVALVPMTYLFGLKLFRDRFYAFCGAALMMVEFMRFAQSRVAVIDVFGVFFIMAMYYFILDLFPAEGEPPRRSADVSLLLSGIAFGIGAACKWIAIYAGGGLALLVIVRTVKDLMLRPEGERGRFLLRRFAVGFLAFGLIPAGIYLLAYLPYLALPGPGHDLAGIVRLQEHILNYHRTLKATHPFSSPWWSWPLDLRPMWMYTGSGLPQGEVSTIASFGNPAVFWLAIPAVAVASYCAVRRRDAGMGVVLTALLFQYLPWVGINRLVFIYHFFSSVPFVIFCIVAAIRSAEERFPRFRAVTWGYLAVAAGLFVLFYPVLSGLQVPANYVAELKWLPTWLF